MAGFHRLRWAALGAMVGVAGTLGVVALTDENDSGRVRVHPVAVNEAARVAGKWAAQNAKAGESYEAGGCEGDEDLIESRFACHVTFTQRGSQKVGREVTVYIAYTEAPIVSQVRTGFHRLPYRAAVYETPTGKRIVTGVTGPPYPVGP